MFNLLLVIVLIIFWLLIKSYQEPTIAKGKGQELSFPISFQNPAMRRAQ